jgi:Kef-type K+ transport system membrane component KefB
LKDIVLWAVLAIATAIAKTGTATNAVTGSVTGHIVATVIYMGFAMILAPRLLRRIVNTRWNLLYRSSPVGYLAFILFVYCAIASLVDVSLVFAAFLAGFGIIGGISGTERERFREPLEAIAKFSFGVFIPIYFGIVGYKLVFGAKFSLGLLIFFFLGSTVLSLATSGLAARLAGFRKLDILNIALTTNARGGPGIVLASVAYDSGIINATFYTTLVLTAVFTSQLAGTWLRYVLSKGWPLLSTNPNDK